MTLTKRLTIPTIRRRSLLVDCWYELQKYVQASGFAQRRAEEEGNNFVIAELHGQLGQVRWGLCFHGSDRPSEPIKAPQ